MKKVSKEKKKSLIFVILLSVVLIVLLLVLLFLEFKPIKDSNKLVNSFYEKYNSKQLEVIYYESSQCGYCSLQTPILEEISDDYNMDYLQIDITKLTESKRKEISKKLGIEGATPSTVVVKEGKVIAKQEGYLDGIEYVEFLQGAGVLDPKAVYKSEQYLSFIEYNKYKEIIVSENPQIIVLGQTGCSHCVATKPVLNKLAKKYNIVINYLNITKMEENDYKELLGNLKLYGYDESEYISSGSVGTPLTLVFKSNKIIGYLNGESPNVKYVKLFTKTGIITE